MDQLGGEGYPVPTSFFLFSSFPVSLFRTVPLLLLRISSTTYSSFLHSLPPSPPPPLSLSFLLSVGVTTGVHGSYREPNRPFFAVPGRTQDRDVTGFSSVLADVRPEEEEEEGGWGNRERGEGEKKVETVAGYSGYS